MYSDQCCPGTARQRRRRNQRTRGDHSALPGRTVCRSNACGSGIELAAAAFTRMRGRARRTRTSAIIWLDGFRRCCGGSRRRACGLRLDRHTQRQGFCRFACARADSAGVSTPLTNVVWAFPIPNRLGDWPPTDLGTDPYVGAQPPARWGVGDARSARGLASYGGIAVGAQPPARWGVGDARSARGLASYGSAAPCAMHAQINLSQFACLPPVCLRFAACIC